MRKSQLSSYRLGLTGYPLGHSLSPKLHAAALQSTGLDGEYQLYPVPPDDPQALAQLLGGVRAGELDGLNVTIPHKQAVIPLLDELSPSAQAIGAVNTIYLKGGKLIGHNTDAPGFLADLRRTLGVAARSGGRALVLGSGGAARAVVYALLTGGWDITLAIRAADTSMVEALIKSFRRDTRFAHRGPSALLLEAGPLQPVVNGMQLIVNTTPLGMSPEVNVSPWPENLPFPQAAVYDVVYNPRETLFVKQARAAGLRAETGLGMLVSQAALSFETWTGRVPSIEAMFEAAGATR
jgi:shikimate dehydrogenase